jgi:hypothetical protein
MNKRIRDIEVTFIIHNGDEELCRFIETLMETKVDPNAPIVIFDDRVFQPTFDQIVDTNSSRDETLYRFSNKALELLSASVADDSSINVSEPRSLRELCSSTNLTQAEAFRVETDYLAHLPPGMGKEAVMVEIEQSFARISRAKG